MRTQQQSQLQPKKPPLCNPLLLGAKQHVQSTDHFTVPSKQQQELLKPRKILMPPSNIIYQKRCMSARNNFNPFASQSDLGGNQMQKSSFDSQFDDSVFQTSIMSRRKKSKSPRSKRSRSPPKAKKSIKAGLKNDDMWLELDSFGLF